MEEIEVCVYAFVERNGLHFIGRRDDGFWQIPNACSEDNPEKVFEKEMLRSMCVKVDAEQVERECLIFGEDEKREVIFAFEMHNFTENFRCIDYDITAWIDIRKYADYNFSEKDKRVIKRFNEKDD